MAIEREYKFLVKSGWKPSSIIHSDIINVEKMIQGYLLNESKRTVRVRTSLPARSNGKGFLTIKGETHDASRPEFEYEIRFSDAVEMLHMCESTLRKTRTTIACTSLIPNLKWEVDVFEGRLSGLIVAELELPADIELSIRDIVLPDWIDREVTDDVRYYNSQLILNGIPK